MAHVNVGASAIEKETSVAGRFVPIALMQVSQSEAVFVENPIADSADCTGRPDRIVNQTAVFRLQSDNPIHKPT
jgi:hypothetical protein